MELPGFEYFYFIRHGRTSANEQGIMAGGSNDIALNPTGHSQAEKAALILQEKCPEIQTICASTMTRAKQTAGYIQQKLQKPLIEVPELIEWCFGDWEGKSWEEVIPRFLSDESPANGETRAEFQARVFKGLQKSLVHPGPVIVVAHGGVWYKVQKIFNLPLLKSDNCQIFKIYRNSGNNGLVDYNFHEIYL